MIQKINYAYKQTGGKFSASDANEIKSTVNSNADVLSENSQSILSLQGGSLGPIKPTDAAPTPARNGNYMFSIGGAKPAWLTAEAGITTVKAGDGVAVVYAAPSSYTYTHVDIGSSIEQARSQSTSKVPSSKLLDDELNKKADLINGLVPNSQMPFTASPHGVFASLAALKAAYPTGTTGIYVTSDNGHWYFWGADWTDGGVYQSSLFLDSAFIIHTVNDFGAVPDGYKVAIVQDSVRGGIFYIGSGAENNGTIFNDGSRTWIRLYQGAANVKWFGVVGDGITNDQTSIDAMMETSILSFYFPAGVYRTYINNTKSNRTFIFEEGAIIDGVVHLAIGSGPDIGGQPIITWVENTRVIGTLASTVRIGTYYCKKVHADKFRIVDVNPAYYNQTTEGGTRGVHLYLATHNLFVNEIICDSATQSGCALGIDLNTTTDDDHKPTDIHIGKVTVKNNTQIGLAISSSLRVTIDEANIDWAGSSHGCAFYENKSMKIGKIYIDGTGSTGSGSAIYNFSSDVNYGEINTAYSAGIGFYLYGGDVTINSIVSHHNGTDGVKLLTKAVINKIVTYNNTQKGLNIPESYSISTLKIGFIESYSNTMDNIFVESASDIEIDTIISYNGSTWGLYLDGCTKFKNKYLKAYGNVQGLRYVGNTDSFFGVLNLHDNSNYDIAIAGTNSGFFVIEPNFTTSNTPLTSIPKYRTIYYDLFGSDVFGDVNISLTCGDSNQTQRCGIELTANRTITLTNTNAVNGSKFRIVRTTTSTGAFTIDVAGLKLLSTGQWCDVEFNGVIWHLTAFGSL